MRRVLVTGAGGFLGRHLCQAFAGRGWDVLAVGRGDAAAPGPLSRERLDPDDPSFAECLGDFVPEVVVHAAGPASVPASVAAPLADFSGNVGLTAALLDAVRRQLPGCRFVFLSSGAVYGNAMAAVAEDCPLAPLSPYGWHKRIGEMLCEEYRSLHGIDTRVVRIFSAYGSGQRKQVIHDLARQLLDPDCRRIEVIGSGEEARDFIDARDVAAAVVHCLDHVDANCINIGSGTATRIRDVVDRLREICGGEHEIVYTGSTRTGDPGRMCADISRLHASGFRPAVPLASGLADYCNWLHRQPRGTKPC